MNKISLYQNSRRDFLKNGSTALAAAALLGLGIRTKGETKHRLSVMDEPNTHNMLVVGQETVFLSHLPMFMPHDTDSPHRYQVILEATFSKDGANPQAVYTSDRKKNPAVKIYTLGPEERFVLPNLMSAEGQAPVSSFVANVFRGHLERKGMREILNGINVTVKNVIHFREFDPQATKLAQLEYILFGKGKELFLAHFITRPPDFDQVLSVTAADHSFTDEELRKGMRVVFERPNSIAQRLIGRQEAVAQVRDSEGTANPLKVKFKAGTEFYLEEGELRMPAAFGSTQAEKKAGFP